MGNPKLPNDKKSCSLYLSARDLDFLNLLALDRGYRSQSKAASVLIESASEQEPEIIKQIAARLFENWKLTNQEFNQFIRTASPWMSAVKRISKEHIKKIVIELRDLHDSRK